MFVREPLEKWAMSKFVVAPERIFLDSSDLIDRTRKFENNGTSNVDIIRPKFAFFIMQSRTLTRDKEESGRI